MPRLALAVFGVMLVGCGQEEERGGGFDPKFIASEADKGNLAPLRELNGACSNEVREEGKRSSACAVQDRVRELRKRFDIRF